MAKRATPSSSTPLSDEVRRRLDALRRDRGIPSTFIAAKTGLPAKWVQRYFAGSRGERPTTVVSIASLWPWRIYIATLQYSIWAGVLGVWVALAVGLFVAGVPGAGTATIVVAMWRGHDEAASTIAGFLLLFAVVKYGSLWLLSQAGGRR